MNELSYNIANFDESTISRHGLHQDTRLCLSHVACGLL